MARQFLEDARAAYERESYPTAVNRAYYSLFKTISALQAADGVQFRSHGQAIGAFNHRYIYEEARFPKEYGRKLYDIMELRHTSDYDDFSVPTEEETMDAIAFAEEFLSAVKKYYEEGRRSV